MKLRFMIYDLRLALAGERRLWIFCNRKSAIINHQSPATASPAAQE